MPITEENVRAVCDLSVSKEQEHFVTSAAISLAEAGVHPQAWCRAIQVPGAGLVGFVMLHDTTEEPGYMLWRLLVDQRFQGRGYGRAAVRAVADYVRERPGAQHLKVGARRGTGSHGPSTSHSGSQRPVRSSTATKTSWSWTSTTSRWPSRPSGSAVLRDRDDVLQRRGLRR